MAKKMNGVKEIARRANVSIATVDRVLHNRPGVSPATKRKIERIIKELDYKPNIIASRLASNKIYNLAVLIPQVSKETNFWQGPLNGIKRAHEMIEEYGIKIKYYFFDVDNRPTFKEEADRLIESEPDGVLLAPSFLEEAIQISTICTKKRIPFILIDSNIPEHEGLCYIGPHLFRSGFLSAQVMNFGLLKKSKILVMNISKNRNDHNYLTEIEDGFRAYFRYNSLFRDILKSDVTLVDDRSISVALDRAFEKHPDLRFIFVTNSRVSMVAKHLEESSHSRVFLLGYDYTEENIEYLKKGIIDVLICHKSEEQGYLGIMNLYRHLVLGEGFPKTHFMPIDIVTKENYEFYNN